MEFCGTNKWYDVVDKSVLCFLGCKSTDKAVCVVPVLQI